MNNNHFAQCPLYPSQKRYRPIYINSNLYQRIIDPAPADWASMSAQITDLFSVTIDPALSAGDAIGYAYADYQQDPLDISLSGNEGSGRAYYLGQYFNLKGEKTPLCTATDPRISDGVLEIERGIWETISSNVLAHDLSLNVPAVLAILDMDEVCKLHTRDTSSRRVRIIRMNTDDALWRIAHLFQTQEPLSAETLETIAEALGQQEGEKWLQRILHGAWSAGNVTPHGGLIDFDTICMVKGRHPLYSFTRWYSDNYFGFETSGQKKILGSLADHPAINRDQVSTPKLHERCERKREETIAEQLPFYMGFAPSPALYAAHQTELDALCAKLIQLGSYYFPKTDMLNAVNPWSHMLHIADFSLLFRIYPLLKRCMAFDLGYLCTLITDSSFIYEPLEPTTPQWQTERDEPHYAAYVATQIAPYAVQEAAHLEALHHEIRQFITDYDLLWEDMLQSSAQDRLAAEARAYAINEDRRYLMPPFSLSTALGEMAAETPEDRLSTLIQRVIDASLRSPDAWPLRTELQCYAEGYACILLDGQGEHTNQLVIEDPMLIERIVAAKQVTITIDEHHFTPALNPQNSGLFLISPPQDNDALIEACTRSASYLVKKIMVNLDGTDYSLNEFGHP